MAFTRKQQLFIDSYFANGFNATRAAITAGYSEDTAYSQGSRLLKDVEIKAEVERRFDELVLPPAEILARLSEHARGDLGDIWDEESGQIDWKKARAAGKTGLIRRFKHKTIRTTNPKGEDTEIFEDEIELQNPQKALELIGKHRRLFIDRTEISGVDGKPIEVKGYMKFSPDEWDDDSSAP